MDDLVKTARRAKGSDLLPKVSFGTMNAETLILRMADRIEELEALVEALTAKGEKADKMERALRWIGYKSPIIDASPATIQRHARAALAEQEKDDE